MSSGRQRGVSFSIAGEGPFDYRVVQCIFKRQYQIDSVLSIGIKSKYAEKCLEMALYLH
jgi:hypothetical protein